MVFCTGFTRGRKAKLSISWYFFTEGFVLGNWAALLPVAKDEQHLSNQVLGAVLVAAILGALSALPLVSYVSKRWGSGVSLFCGALLSIALFPIVGVKGNLPVFVFGVYLLGFGLGWADVAMNTQAVLCEKVTRLPTIGLFHSLYAVGGLVGALVAGVLVQQGLSVLGEVLTIIAILVLPEILFSYWLYTSQEEKLFIQSNVQFSQQYRQYSYDKVDQHDRDTHALIGLPTSDNELHEGLLAAALEDQRSGASSQSDHSSLSRSTLDDPPSVRQADWQSFVPEPTVDYRTLGCISLLCFLGYFGYGSVGDWSAIYLDEEFDASALESTLGFVGFSLFVALGTYGSDLFAARFGRRRLLQLSGLVTATGLLVAVAAADVADHDFALGCSIAGFSICGMGISVVSPTVISLAGSSVRGMDPTDAIAFVSSVGYVGIMVGPPLLGGISALLNGLRWSLIVDAALMLNITVFAFLVVEGTAPLKKPTEKHLGTAHEEISIQ